MPLRPETFEQAKAAFKALKRTGFVKGTLCSFTAAKKAPIARKPSKLASKKKAKKKKVVTRKHVWKEFSIYIRLRDADPSGFVRCVTCDEPRFWKDMQAGHFIRGRLNANLFEERGCHAQCYVCNIHYQGNVVIYYKFMLKKYGQGVIDELILQNTKTKKWAPGELAGLLAKYKGLNETNPLVKSQSKISEMPEEEFIESAKGIPR